MAAVVDCFALLGLPRRAALDAEVIKQAYFEMSKAQADAAGVNHAFEILSAPEKRLKHLLELTAGDEVRTWRVVTMDEGLVELFAALGPFLQAVAAFDKRLAGAQTALARALLAGEQARLTETAEDFAARLSRMREGIEGSLQGLDHRLDAGEATALRDLHAVQSRLAYLAKWQSQVREAFMALA